ncbi:MAG: class I SAM-dependent methyltransferase [Betaproteobacteria bacterium]|nr:class I SAM-dependent methyltransferase [Betaproteobacteria bacterium]MBI2958959.1 class I SAM-dependent methyltransferase [Betaproteobacteria bacterium]
MDKERIKVFADRLFGDMAGAMSAGLGFVGVKTGLFRAMAGKGALTLEEIVGTTKLHSRYVEEWLKGMVCAGYLEYEPGADTYRLPDEHAFLVASEGTDHFMGGLFCMAPVLLRVAPKVALAFEKGGGVPFEDYGADGIEALDLINRGQYEQRFAGHWLKALPAVVARLEAGGRVLDVGCGVGRVALTLARAFPRATIMGLDPDRESVRQASAAAEAEGLAARVWFSAAGAGELGTGEKFDLITACDCVHDFARPLETLKEIRARLAPDGVLLVIEPKAADRLEDNQNSIATMYYGFSVFHCMTQSLAQGGPGLGTCMGPARTGALMREAGFARFEILDIKSQVLAFYAVRP